MSDMTDTDPLDSLSEERVDQLVEFIEQLQAMVDSSEQRVADLERRVNKLVEDRETLRQRVATAQAELSTARRGRRRPVVGRSASLSPADDILPHETQVDGDSTDSGIRVATILDPISDACWSPEFTNIRLSRHTWSEQLEVSDPELLLVESAFAGVDGSWSKRIARFGRPHVDLVQLVEACRGLGIPTVFWNKEDPVNFGWFIGAASLFDRVFTVDADQIPRYVRDLSRRSVGLLPFAAQPTLHYPPADQSERTGQVGFAGSYYARKHADRRRQMDMLLTPAISFDLEIFDRMGLSPDPRFQWPERFRERVVGSVPYAEMGDVYRRYKAFINVNTVTASPTMCARRVFELAAADTPIVSGPSRAIELMVPPGIAHIARSEPDVTAALQAILFDTGGHERGAGPAWIAEGHTYAERLDTILG
jgi:glycosyl transferase family 1